VTRGKFITFEGGEGTGKSTHAARVAQRLESLGIGVRLTREPGGSAGGEIIRHVLLSGAAKPLGGYAEAMLFAAARCDHIQHVIEPALAAGKWVVCDRFVDSTRVYQGVAGAVDQKFIRALERISVGDLTPDLTLVLDVPAALGLERAGRRRGGSAKPDRFEGEETQFHDRLRQAYLSLAAAEPLRCVLIDTTAPKQEVEKRIWDAVNTRLEPAMAPLILDDLFAR